MLTTNRTRLSGALVAIPALLIAAATALPAQALQASNPLLDPCTSLPGNLVVNCGFEAPVTGGVVPGWTHLVARGSATSTNVANSGTTSLRFGSASGDDVWTQTIQVKPNTQYLVGAQFYATDGGGTTKDNIEMTATNVAGSPGLGYNIFSSVDTNISWTRGAQIVTTGSGHSMTLTLSGNNVPSQDYVDDVFVIAQRSGCAVIANNRVGNCGFEAATAGPWNNPVQLDSQISANSNGGLKGLRIASTTTDDIWNQTFAVRPHTKYTLTYWVQYRSNGSSPVNDLHVSISNVSAPLSISTANVADKFWAPVTRTFTTGAGSTSTLTVAGANHPAESNVDDFSVTAVPHVAVSHAGRKVTTTLTGVGGQKVRLLRLVHNHWVIFGSFTAPKTGWSASWKVTVRPGKFRAVALAAPGYAAATSSTITVH